MSREQSSWRILIKRIFSGQSLAAFAFQRVVQAIPSVFAVITIGFILLNLAPGDPVNYILGDSGDAELAARVRARLGLDAPLHVRYFTYVSSILKGQLGRSYIYGRPVSEMISKRIPATLLLFTAQFVLSSILGIGLGVFAAHRKGSIWDKLTIALSVLWYSTPVFWSGQLLLLFFSLHLGIFPSYGMRSIQAPAEGIGRILDIASHLTLPMIAFALLNLALIARLTRSSMVETLREDYILTARAKGIPEGTVIRRHALRNTLLPVVTVQGMMIGQSMAGAILTETVFSWPGLGRLMYDAIVARDYPVVLGLFILVSSVVILANLLTDLLYALLDPRVRLK